MLLALAHLDSPRIIFAIYLSLSLSLSVSLSFITSAERINLPMLAYLISREGRKQAWRTGMDGCILPILLHFASIRRWANIGSAWHFITRAE